jgi:hypothetical protein
MSLNDKDILLGEINDLADDEYDNKIEDEDGSIYPTAGVEIGALDLAHDAGSGSYADDGRLEVAEDQMADVDDVGSAAMYGETEIGRLPTPFEIFMLDETRMGAQYAVDGATEVGSGQAALEGGSEIGAGYYPMDGKSEIGAEAAVVKVIEKARDNRRPPPPMKAVEVDEPSSMDEDYSEELTEAIVGAAAASGNLNPFPLTTELMRRAGAGMEPRYVRLDTEESYKQFRTDNSPELSELREKLEAHIADPHAHEGPELADGLSDDIEDLVHLGAEAEAAEKDKQVDLWMPKHFDGDVTSWCEGDYVGASMRLPGGSIATTLEPKAKCVAEMGRHAIDADVPAAMVGHVLSAMGCVLGAATGLKEMAAATPDLIQRTAPCVLRVEPKLSPALAALAMLAMAARKGNKQASEEWQNLAALAPAPVKQAMTEAVQLAKAVG